MYAAKKDISVLYPVLECPAHHKTDLLGKKHTLMKYRHDCYRVTKSFLIGFEDCSKGGNSSLVLLTFKNPWLALE